MEVTHYKLHTGVCVYPEEEGDFAIAVLPDGKKFHLNASACRALSDAIRGFGLDEIAADFSARYEIQNAKALED